MPTNTHWPLERRAEVLALLIANEGHVLATARQSGVPESTIRTWINRAEGEQKEELLRLRAVKQSALADQFEQLAEAAVAMSAEKIAAGQVSARDAAVTAGIAVDKMLLLR